MKKHVFLTWTNMTDHILLLDYWIQYQSFKKYGEKNKYERNYIIQTSEMNKKINVFLKFRESAAERLACAVDP